jgi:hypothetical protein
VWLQTVNILKKRRKDMGGDAATLVGYDADIASEILFVAPSSLEDGKSDGN